MNQQELNNKLTEINDKLIGTEQPAGNRTRLLCHADNTYAVNQFLFEDVAARFVTCTGIDAEDCFEIIYHYSYDQTGTCIDLKVFIHDRENPAVESITPLLPAAEWIEREMHDVLGIDFKNHPNLERLLLADDWPEGVYPMRKDFSPGESKEAKE